MSSDDIVKETLNIYSSLRFQPANVNQYNILASIALKLNHVPQTDQSIVKVISLATGAKCLPESRLSASGDTLHDSHAEILARRGFIRWLLEEVRRSVAIEKSQSTKSGCVPSLWIERDHEGHKWHLKQGVTLHLYISTLPCGDASTRTLSLLPQDPEIAALKNTRQESESECLIRSLSADNNDTVVARGRENYSLLGVLRTKPGRADSEMSFSMSCSDKIARWSILGIQGALLTTLFDPIYVNEIIIGGVDDKSQDMVREDCHRAFWKRVDRKCLKDVPPIFKLHAPSIAFTALAFPFSRASLETRLGSQSSYSSSNECLCWISDSNKRPNFEVIINGLRRGVDDKQRLKPKLRPMLSKISLFTLYQETIVDLNLPPLSRRMTYYEAKLDTVAYQEAKEALRKDDSPFAGWIASGKKWEDFTVH